VTDDETLRVYATRAADYAELASASAAEDPLLKAFIADLPTSARVLDLGCGPGHAAGTMARAGCDAHAWDPVVEMLTFARRFPGVTARQKSFDDLQGHALWHGIWASFSLLHARREDMPRHLKTIRQALLPGGLFHLGLKTGQGSARDALGRWYCFYGIDEILALLADVGFTPSKTLEGEDAGLSGDVSQWVRINART
jgi:SAM-dependent methyltransferase